MKPRKLRRLLDRRIIKAARKRGVDIPERYPCPLCRGTGKRWKLLPRWIAKCRVCRGSGLDPVKALDRLRYQVLASGLANQQGKP
jgi:hypothetical protein